jgi:transposase
MFVKFKSTSTITGVDLFTATTLHAAIGNDISRFSSPKKLVSYLSFRLPQVIVKYPSPLRVRAFFQRLYAKKGRNKSIIAVASKLTRIIWHMLTNGEDYRYQSYVRTRMKLTRLKFLASGVYKKGGRMIKDIGCGKKAEKQYKTMVRKRMGRR